MYPENQPSHKPKRRVLFYIFTTVVAFGMINVIGALILLLFPGEDESGLSQTVGLLMIALWSPLAVAGIVGMGVVNRNKSSGKKIYDTKSDAATGSTNDNYLYGLLLLFIFFVAFRIFTDKYGDDFFEPIVDLPFGLLISFGILGIWMAVGWVCVIGLVLTLVVAFRQKSRSDTAMLSFKKTIAISIVCVFISGIYVLSAAHRSAEYEKTSKELDSPISRDEALKLMKSCVISDVSYYEGVAILTREKKLTIDTGWSGEEGSHEVYEYTVNSPNTSELIRAGESCGVKHTQR